MESAMIVAQQSVIMLILLAVGYGLYKGKLIGDEASKQLSDIAITIINPIVIFNAYQTDFDHEKLRGLIIALVLSFAAQGILVGAAAIIVRSTRKNFEIERFALGYTNCAFMGIPLVQATFGSEGVFYLTAFITAFNIFMWTHGVILMSGGEKKTAKQRAKEFLKILLSPAIIAIILGLVFFFTGFRLPDAAGLSRLDEHAAGDDRIGSYNRKSGLARLFQQQTDIFSAAVQADNSPHTVGGFIRTRGILRS